MVHKPAINRGRTDIRNGVVSFSDDDDQDPDQNETATNSGVKEPESIRVKLPSVPAQNTSEEAPVRHTEASIDPSIKELLEWDFRKGLPRGTGLIEQLFRRFGKSPKELSDQDRELFEAAVRKASNLYRERLAYRIHEDWLTDVCNTVSAHVDNEIQTWYPIAGVVYVSNHKGGVGKSSVSVELANKLAQKSEGGVLLLPIASNDGTTHVQAAVVGEHTLTLIQLEQALLELTNNGTQRANSKMLKSMLRYNANRVYVIAQESLPNSFGGKRLAWIIDQLKEIFQFIVLDGGNDVARFDEQDKSLPEGGNTEYAAAKVADVILVSAYTQVSASFKGIGDTMKHFSLLDDKAKLARSIVVINGHRPSDPIDIWVKYAQNIVEERPDLGERLTPLPYDFDVKGKGKLSLMPWSDKIRSSKTNELELLDTAGHMALTELTYEVVQRIADQQQIDVERLYRILSADRQGFSNATQPLATSASPHDN